MIAYVYSQVSLRRYTGLVGRTEQVRGMVRHEGNWSAIMDRQADNYLADASGYNVIEISPVIRGL